MPGFIRKHFWKICHFFSITPPEDALSAPFKLFLFNMKCVGTSLFLSIFSALCLIKRPNLSFLNFWTPHICMRIVYMRNQGSLMSSPELLLYLISPGFILWVLCLARGSWELPCCFDTSTILSASRHLSQLFNVNHLDWLTTTKMTGFSLKQTGSA